MYILYNNWVALSTVWGVLKDLGGYLWEFHHLSLTRGWQLVPESFFCFDPLRVSFPNIVMASQQNLT